ncbi:MAG: hypothetical protein AAGF33_00505 [Pseudomonadota bacterium]
MAKKELMLMVAVGAIVAACASPKQVALRTLEARQNAGVTSADVAIQKYGTCENVDAKITEITADLEETKKSSGGLGRMASNIGGSVVGVISPAAGQAVNTARTAKEVSDVANEGVDTSPLSGAQELQSLYSARVSMECPGDPPGV